MAASAQARGHCTKIRVAVAVDVVPVASSLTKLPAVAAPLADRQIGIARYHGS